MAENLVDHPHDRRDGSNLARHDHLREGSSSNLYEQQKGLTPAGSEPSIDQTQKEPIREGLREQDQQEENYRSHTTKSSEPMPSGQVCR